MSALFYTFDTEHTSLNSDILFFYFKLKSKEDLSEGHFFAILQKLLNLNMTAVAFRNNQNTIFYLYI